ncbi:MAG: GspH/FimT family pseudopilin [Gemmatimonadota bacterium]|nr:GspH/FimT family pseudopilin [Gemmatimonadota bacterium]
MTGRRGFRDGFTLIELLVVLTLSAVMLGYAGLTVGRYFGRTTVRRAAQVFAQDLTRARGFAVRTREPVVLRFDEGAREYEIVTLDGTTEIVRRRFSNSDGVDLSDIELDLDGDSLVFDRRGFADLSGAPGTLGVATFRSGEWSYAVSFNGLGASRIGAS